MLSARSVAKRLSCAQDYVTKLCREGKLRGSQIQGAWFVEEDSIHEFEVSRETARVERSEDLARQRRQEAAQYRRHNEPVDKMPATQAFLGSRKDGNIFASIVSKTGKNAALALAGVLLFGAVAFASGANYIAEHAELTAALAQIESPFFGSTPAPITVSTSSAHSVTGSILGNVFAFFFGSKTTSQVAVAPSNTKLPVTQTVPTQTKPVAQHQHHQHQRRHRSRVQQRLSKIRIR
jgi:hypothetical protein